ncbi:MAG: VOC family protein [Verrucomicrobia bacterium]|nr:VOC family protein [Verrucomicrobiota bacterium]
MKLAAIESVVTCAEVRGIVWGMNSRLFQVAVLFSLTVVAVAFAAEKPPRILGISHVAVKASDVEKSVAFYRDFLGFAERSRTPWLANRCRHRMRRCRNAERSSGKQSSRSARGSSPKPSRGG